MSMAMHPDLAELLALMDGYHETPAARASDDQRRAQLIDLLSQMDSDGFMGLSELINDKTAAAQRADARQDVLIYELAMQGWNAALESLLTRLRDAEECDV